MAPQLVTSFDVDQLAQIRGYINFASRIIVVTGAGITTNHGIPDFRSANGLRNQTVKYALTSLYESYTIGASTTRRDTPRDILCSIDRQVLNSKCTSLFESSVLTSQSATIALHRLCALMGERVRGLSIRDDSVHKLISDLHKQDKLTRCYTQNIDGLEMRYGLQTDIHSICENGHVPDKTEYNQFQVVQLHGDLQTIRCNTLSCLQPWSSDVLDAFLAGYTLRCTKCQETQQARQDRGKRSISSTYEPVVRPNIVLYHEEHPLSEHIASVLSVDIAQQPDLLLIIGTSLKTTGVQHLIRDVSDAIHRYSKGKVIYINRTTHLGAEWNSVIDLHISMDCDDWTTTTFYPVSETKKKQHDDYLNQNESMKVIESTTNSSQSSIKVNDAASQDVKDRMWLEAFFD